MICSAELEPTRFISARSDLPAPCRLLSPAMYTSQIHFAALVFFAALESAVERLGARCARRRVARSATVMAPRRSGRVGIGGAMPNVSPEGRDGPRESRQSGQTVEKPSG